SAEAALGTAGSSATAEASTAARPTSAVASDLDLATFALPSPSLMAPSRAPTATVSPCLTAISESTPEAGAGTSTVTLSVSSSTKGSAAETASPACLNHWPTVASTIDSPRFGTRISVAMPYLSVLGLAYCVVEPSLECADVLAHEPGRCRWR